MSAIYRSSGYLRLATIKEVDVANMLAYVSFNLSSTKEERVPVQFPVAYLSADGGFIGGKMAPGTPVVIGQAEGSNNYFIVQFLPHDPAVKSNTSPAKLTDLAIKLKDNELLIRAGQDAFINLKSDSIVIGEPNNNITIDTGKKLTTNTINYHFTESQASREVIGDIRRDRKPNLNVSSVLRNSSIYFNSFKVIGMDPTANVSNFNTGNTIRNPARIEKRELIFEYEDAANIKSNDVELEYYKTGKFNQNFSIINRRESRADALSLSLVAPNQLMETIKGTVVDIYGNVLDLNRSIIPLGNKDKNLSISQAQSTAGQDTFTNAYEQIKRAERRSLAYHFEVNTKKELLGSGFPDVNDRSDYARLRSRFFLDIDKEGQFKLNVPASSETGNIPLPTRYENFSTVSPNEKSKDPNDITFNQQYQDVLTETFANTGIVQLQDDLHNTSAPIDRFSSSDSPQYIKHGTVYHDISATVSTLQAGNFYTPREYDTTSPLAAGKVPPIKDIVSKTVITTGINANAGGRSGSLNFDGSIEINVGANTVDRQSMWLDTQGGVVANIGRDLQGISLAANMDGEVLIQIGGETVPAESKRFIGQTGFIAGALDIRVFNAQQEMTVLRIDNVGLTITTPGQITQVASRIVLRAEHITIDADDLLLNSREVIRDPGKGFI